jgi:hypothetical protein
MKTKLSVIYTKMLRKLNTFIKTAAGHCGSTGHCDD